MRTLLIFAFLLLPGTLWAQAIDSLQIVQDDSVSQAMGRPVAVAFVLPTLSGSAAVDSARVQVKIVGGSWADYLEDMVALKFRKEEAFVIRGLPFDSLRFVADTAQADTMWVHYIVR